MRTVSLNQTGDKTFDAKVQEKIKFSTQHILINVSFYRQWVIFWFLTVLAN